MAVALLSLVVAMGGTGYAALKLPKNSVGRKQIKRNAVVSSKVKKDTLTGDDVNESRLGSVPTAGRAGSAGNSDRLGGRLPNGYVRTGTKVGQAGHADTAGNADTVDDKNASDFVGTGANADGDLFGPFSNLSLRSNTVGTTNVDDDSLLNTDILDYDIGRAAFGDATSNAIPVTNVLDAGTPATITAVCNKSAAGITGSIVITNPVSNWAVTSNAPNADVGQVGVAGGAERKLIAVGPTAADAFSAGSFYMMSGATPIISGLVAVRVNR